MKRGSVVVVAVVVALVAGACAGSDHKASRRKTPSGAGATGVASEGDLKREIRLRGLTPERAVKLFALDVGPLPGASIAGIEPESGNFDATDAVSYLHAEWEHLTKAQRDAAARLLAPARTLRSGTRRPRGLTGRPHVVLLAAHPGARPADTPGVDFLALAKEADTEEATELGVPAVGEFVIEVSDAVAKPKAEAHYYEKPTRILDREFGGWKPYSDGCHIVVWEKNWASVDAESSAAVMAHEVFHCFAQRAAGLGANGRPNYLVIPDWVGEGEATWVMAQLHPSAAVVGDKWSAYAFTPETKYFDRSYDAVGVFGHYGDVAGGQDDVWHLLLAVNNAAIGCRAGAGEDALPCSAAFTKLVNSTTERYYSSWGSSYYEDQGHTDWHMAGPGTPPTAGPSPQSVTVDAGDAQDIGILGMYQAKQTTIQSSADVLVVTLASGYGKAHGADDKLDATLDTSAPLALCLNANGCKCPDGSPGASEHTTPATAPIRVGMDGGDQQLAAYAAGASLDQYCKKPDPPPPTGGTPPPHVPGGGGGGGEPEPPAPAPGISAGDPHLTTFDGTSYDLQTVGEMTLVKSSTDDFAVQVRTAPVAGSDRVALNAAIATRIGGRRVQIGQENGAVQARVDGRLVIDEVTRVGSASLQRIGTSGGGGYTVVWPDSTTVRVDAMGIVGVNVTVTPARSRRGKLTGLLGNDDGRADEYVTGDGHSLGTAPTRAVLNTTFTSSWRVTPATSLFTYGPGQSTATFTDPTFPHADAAAGHMPDRATVEKQCREQGITDRFLLDDCIVDASALHSPVVLSHYAQAQTVRSVRDAIAHHRPPFSPSSTGGPDRTPATTTTSTTVAGSGGAQRTVVDVGRVSDPHESVPFSFPGHAGDVVWIGPPTCDAGGLVFALVDPAGKTLDQDDVDMGVLGCQAGRFELPADGDYQLVANADKQRAGGYSVPIRFQRRDVTAHASFGQKISGSIHQPAAHDVYLFEARAGDVVHISGPGCTIGPADSITAVGFQKADGTPVGGIFDCSEGSRNVIPESGTYRLVVNFADEGPFSYAFVLQR